MNNTDKTEITRNKTTDGYGDDWRRHYQTSYGTTGQPYDFYEPAYQYGMSLRNESRYRDWAWDRLEPDARRTWEERYPRTTWDQISGSVRHAWENFKEAIRD